MRLLLCILAPVFSLAAAESKDRLVRDTEPLSPAQELAGLKVPAGFSAQLFASEPMIHKPINLAFDTRGRLWVSSTREYPFAASRDRWLDEQGSRVKDSVDAIRILQDTDGDGAADKVTVFADGLNIPTGVQPWHKPEHKAGCIAFSIPNIWYLADTDGDDRADVREVIFGPLGYEKDTHGMCSSFRLGMDGWIYATHGFSNTSSFHAKDGSRVTLHSGNTFRFRPDGSRVQQWTSGQVNPFGLCWDRYNNLYSADCHSNPMTQLLRGACYQSFGKPHDGLGYAPVMCEHSHGSTGLCGILYLDGGVWGEGWDNYVLVGNCVTSRVNQDRISFSGSTPKAHEAPDFLTSSDPWFRPVDLQLGPDSALYVADFYNRVIGHYEVPLDHPGRDRERGRIWRVVRDGVKAGPADFTQMDASALAGELGNANLTRRHLALREIKLRDDKKMLPELGKVFEKFQPMGDTKPEGWMVGDDVGDFHHSKKPYVKAWDMKLAHALWAMSYLGERFIPPAVMRDLHTGGWWVEDQYDDLGKLIPDRQNGLVMSHAAQIIATHELLHPWENWSLSICFDYRGSAAGRAVCSGLLGSQALLQQDLRAQSFSVEMLVELLDEMLGAEGDIPLERKNDPQFVLALKILLRDWLSQPGVLAQVQWQRRVREIVDKPWFKELLESTPGPDAARYLLSSYSRSEASARQIARYGDEATVRSALGYGYSLRAMNEGFAERGEPLPPLFIQRVIAELEVTLAKQKLSLPWASTGDAETWCVEQRKDERGNEFSVFSSLNQTKPGAEQKRGVLRSPGFPSKGSLRFVICGHQGFPKADANHKTYARLVDTKGRVLIEENTPRSDVVKFIIWPLDQIESEIVFLELVDEDDGTAYAWIGAGYFSVDALDLPLKEHARLKAIRELAPIVQHTAPAVLREQLAPYLPVQKSQPLPAHNPEQRKQADALIAARVAGFAKVKPDAEKGAAVFTSHCAVCHQIAGQGALIGPQLDGIGKRGMERILEDILDPHRNVDSHFRLHELKQKSGGSIFAMARGNVGQVRLLVDGAGKEQRLPLRDILEDKELSQSLMPPVFGQLLSESQCYDLVAWLLVQ